MKVFTSEDLYGHINGGAEAFLELGFEQLTVQKYKDGANELAVEIYRMSDPTSARGIYLSKCGKQTPDPGFKERHTASRQQILWQRHRYYIVLYNTAGGAANAPTLVKTAQAMAPRLPADAPVPVLDVLPAAGLVPGSARVIRGPVSLQALYTLGDGDILQLGGKITGAAGDYKDPSGATTLIIVDYPTPERRHHAHHRRLPDAGGGGRGVQAPHGQPGLVPEADEHHGHEARVPGLREEVRRGHGGGPAAAGAAPPHESAGVTPGLKPAA